VRSRIISISTTPNIDYRISVVTHHENPNSKA
jgi:hypothetical protein